MSTRENKTKTHHQQTWENKPQQISRLKMYKAIRPSRPQKGTTYMTHMTTQREKLTTRPSKNDGPGVDTKPASPFWNGPRLKGIKGWKKGGSPQGGSLAGYKWGYEVSG